MVTKRAVPLVSATQMAALNDYMTEATVNLAQSRDGRKLDKVTDGVETSSSRRYVPLFSLRESPGSGGDKFV